MQNYVDTLASPDAIQRQRALLERIIARPAVHARLVNTFARMEYVGVRKILKSRRSESLDLDGLQHILDETVHALRLKKAALALAAAAAAGSPGDEAAAVATFSEDDTLAGALGEAYMQGVDHAALGALADLADERRVEINYLLSSAAIEVRAQAFYPLYESCLRAAGAPVSVAAIMRDEDRHLAEMGQRLAALLPDWAPRIEKVLVAEGALFDAFLTAVEAELVTVMATEMVGDAVRSAEPGAGTTPAARAAGTSPSSAGL